MDRFLLGTIFFLYPYEFSLFSSNLIELLFFVIKKIDLSPFSSLHSSFPNGEELIFERILYFNELLNCQRHIELLNVRQKINFSVSF